MRRSSTGGTLVLPGPALPPLAEAGLSARRSKTIVALWRAPERLTLAPAWRGDSALMDVAGFGEIGLLAVRRGADGLPSAIPLGVIGAPRQAAEASPVIETARTGAGTLALRGPMVPVQSLSAGRRARTGAASRAGRHRDRRHRLTPAGASATA